MMVRVPRRGGLLAAFVLLFAVLTVGPVSGADESPRSQPPDLARLNLIDETFELVDGTVIPVEDGLPADTPFFIHHGWGVTHETSGGYGSGWNMLVRVELDDGTRILSSPDYRLRTGKELCGVDHPDQCFSFVHVFPEGLPAGVHTFQGWWYAACEDWVANGYIDRCDDPNVVFSPGPFREFEAEFAYPIVVPTFFGVIGDVFEDGQAFAEMLSEEADTDFYLVAADTPAEMHDWFCSAPTSAMGIVPTSVYAFAGSECGADAAFIAFRFGRDHSRSQFVVDTDSTATSIEDLDGLKWAYSSHASFSGYMVPLGMMNAVGVTPGQMLEVGTHPLAVAAVAEDTFATTFDSPPLPDSVRVLAYSEEIPNDALAFGAEYPAELRAAVEEALLDDPSTLLDALLGMTDSLYEWGWDEIRLADDAEWEWFRSMLEHAGIGLEDL